MFTIERPVRIEPHLEATAQREYAAITSKNRIPSPCTRYTDAYDMAD